MEGLTVSSSLMLAITLTSVSTKDEHNNVHKYDKKIQIKANFVDVCERFQMGGRRVKSFNRGRLHKKYIHFLCHLKETQSNMHKNISFFFSSVEMSHFFFTSIQNSANNRRMRGMVTNFGRLWMGERVVSVIKVMMGA